MGQEVCSKNGKRDRSKDKRKMVNIVAELHRGGLYSPGRDGRPISGDEVRANGRLGGLVG